MWTSLPDSLLKFGYSEGRISSKLSRRTLHFLVFFRVWRNNLNVDLKFNSLSSFKWMTFPERLQNA